MSTSPFRMLGARGASDTTGLAKLTVSWEVDTLADALTYTPRPPDGVQLLYKDRVYAETETGSWKLDLNYEGLHGDAPRGDDGIEVSLKGSDSQEPIKSNPNWAELNATYGPWEKQEDGVVGFPEFLRQKASSTNVHAGGGNTTTGQIPNELYGVDSWLVAEGMYEVRMTVRIVPNNLLDGVGVAVAVPPYWRLLGIPLPKGRNFLKLMPDVTRKGNAKSISMRFKMSGPRGVNPLVYKEPQFGSSTRAAGLSTGSLTTGGL